MRAFDMLYFVTLVLVCVSTKVLDYLVPVSTAPVNAGLCACSASVCARRVVCVLTPRPHGAQPSSGRSSQVQEAAHNASTNITGDSAADTRPPIPHALLIVHIASTVPYLGSVLRICRLWHINYHADYLERHQQHREESRKKGVVLKKFRRSSVKSLLGSIVDDDGNGCWNLSWKNSPLRPLYKWARSHRLLKKARSHPLFLKTVSCAPGPRALSAKLT